MFFNRFHKKKWKHMLIDKSEFNSLFQGIVNRSDEL